MFDEYKSKGNKYYEAKDYVNALKWYNKCIEQQQTNPVGYSNKAACLIKLQSYNEAVETANQGLQHTHPSSDSKIVQKLQYRLQLAQDHQHQQNIHITIHETDQLPPRFAEL